MNNDREFELLVDIAKLVKKYGPETFEALAATISSPRFSQHLADILLSSAKTSRVVQKNSKSKTESKPLQRGLRSVLIDLEKAEPEKSALLSHLYDGLLQKLFLPTLKDIKTFVSDIGLQPLEAKSRDKAIGQLVKALLLMPVEELKVKLQGIPTIVTKDDRSLEGWSNIILNREQR